MNRLNYESNRWESFRVFLINALLCVVTLGIYYPWASVRIRKYLLSRLSLGEETFDFKGTVSELWKGYWKLYLACFIFALITAGLGFLSTTPFASTGWPFLLTVIVVYVLILAIVLFVIGVTLHGSLLYQVKNSTWKSMPFVYEGKAGSITNLYTTRYLLCMLTFGIYVPWMEASLMQYIAGNVRFGRLSFRYEGKGKELFLLYLKGFLLGLLTAGIYYIWFFRNWLRYTLEHLVVKIEGAEQLSQSAEFALHTDANMLDIFELLVGNVLISVLTLGIGYGLVVDRTIRFLTQHILLPDGFHVDQIGEETVENRNAEEQGSWLDKHAPVIIV